MPLGQSVVNPASACPACRRPLRWFENVPILSYLALRGRCRRCGTRIPLRYLVIEAATAASFAGAWTMYGPGVLLAARLTFACALIVLFAIDLEHHLLPNAITLPGIVVGFGFSLFTEPGWRASLAGILLGGGTLYVVASAWWWLRHEEALGMGDVKMLAMIGAFTGWQLTIVTLMMASVAGSIVGLFLIATRRGGMKTALPFGTFLALGAAAATTIGPGMLDWYLNLLWR
jgi:leader peptidase (prepilin peptidase)/N-methyltransferase